MKRISVFFTAFLLLFTLSACGNSAETKEAVYSFSGRNEVFEITDGVIILSDEESIFEGGKIRAVNENYLKNLKSFRAEFYTVTNGIKDTVLIDEVINEADDSLDVQADDLGRISSEDSSSIGNIASEDTELFCEIKVIYRDGKEKTSVIELTSEKITG